MISQMRDLKNQPPSAGKVFEEKPTEDLKEHDIDDDLKNILTQKRIMMDYCKEVNKIDVQQHREYWERIKRVHAKLDYKMREQRYLESIALKI